MKQNKIVVFSGAGISAESGLSTFRDHNGLWENHRVEDVATPEAWKRDPGLVLRFYNGRRRAVLAAKPNAAHTGIAGLERDFEVQVITQNIDDLHERAGSSSVLHLHGEILKMRSERTDTVLSDIRGDMLPGARAADGGLLRPHVVWFGEAVPYYEQALRMVQQADIFILIGSSLQVYPAAGLLQFIPASARVFILDKKIPACGIPGAETIEMPATKGMEALLRKLRFVAGDPK